LLKKETGHTEQGKKTVRVPEGLWVKCNNCGEIIYKKEMEQNLYVCLKCSHHHRINAYNRISMVLDEGTFKECDAEIGPVDVLDFKDIKRYKKRIDESQKAFLTKDAIVCGEGLINGKKVMIGAFEFGFMGGSMGSVVGEKIARLFERALKGCYPVTIFSCSGGARMQEGIFSLMQMAKTSAVIAKFKENGCPFISILTDPTTGGVSASFAMLGDIIIAEPRALIGFAGPRVIEQIIRQNLPENFQKSEYLLEHGMIDLIVERKNMKEMLSRLLALLKPENISRDIEPATYRHRTTDASRKK
jgi:acetyl-CoA carboxylase carboxyl transferase subunit beta